MSWSLVAQIGVINLWNKNPNRYHSTMVKPRIPNSSIKLSDENSNSLDLQSSRDSIDTLRNVTIKQEPMKTDRLDGFQSLDDQHVLDLKYNSSSLCQPLQPHQRSLSMNRVSTWASIVWASELNVNDEWKFMDHST